MIVNEQVRAILCPDSAHVLLIKRVREDQLPYWVFPGGRIEKEDTNREAGLRRELYEELGAEVNLIRLAYVLEHVTGAEEVTREFYYLCQLTKMDIKARTGTEFNDPSRGEYILETLSLDPSNLVKINIKPGQLKKWLVTLGLKIFDDAPPHEVKVADHNE